MKRTQKKFLLGWISIFRQLDFVDFVDFDFKADSIFISNIKLPSSGPMLQGVQTILKYVRTARKVHAHI